MRVRECVWPAGVELGASVPGAVSCLLLYITMLAPPVHRVARLTRWGNARTKKLIKMMKKGKFRPQSDLFEGDPPRPRVVVPPEVAVQVVQEYLQCLPQHLLCDGPAWHALGHVLLQLGDEPWHHHLPIMVLDSVKALRQDMTPTHNLMLDQLLAAITHNTNTNTTTTTALCPADVLGAAKMWAPVLVRPPAASECLSCAFLPRHESSLGLTHALYYMAKFGLTVHHAPFHHVITTLTTHTTPTIHTTQGTAEPATEPCDLCHHQHIM